MWSLPCILIKYCTQRRNPEPMNRQEKEIKEQKRIGLAMQALAWFVLIVLGVFFFGDLLDKQYNPNQTLHTSYGEGMKEVVLQRNKHGHYVMNGEINGQPVTFLLDTGATGVAIPEVVAKRLGLRRGHAFSTQTANGMSTGYAATLDSVSVGGITLDDVQAGITPGLQMSQVLLGMSFLRHIEFTQRGDTLILRQYQ